MIPSFLFLLANFILLYFLMIFGSWFVGKFGKDPLSILVSILLLFIGGICPYLTAYFLKGFFESFNYKWYHFVVMLVIIGVLHSVNQNDNEVKESKNAGNMLFGGTIMMLIAMFWLD